MAVDPPVDIAFDCQPLRSIARLDVPLDASEALRHRAGLIKGAVETYGAERTYFLSNARCVFRFANSEIEGVCRFEFEGVVRTDASDRRCELVDLQIFIASETCGGVPDAVKPWLYDRVREAVRIEFDRFLAAGQRGAPAGSPEGSDSTAGFDV